MTFLLCLSSPLALSGASQSLSILFLVLWAPYCFSEALHSCFCCRVALSALLTSCPVVWLASPLPAPPATSFPCMTCPCNKLFLKRCSSTSVESLTYSRMRKRQVFFVWCNSSAGQLPSSNPKHLANHFYAQWIRVAGLFHLNDTVSCGFRHVFSSYVYEKEVIPHQKFLAAPLDGRTMKRLAFPFDDSILLNFVMYIFCPLFCFKWKLTKSSWWIGSGEGLEWLSSEWMCILTWAQPFKDSKTS